jgi:hypothetical protein
LELRELTPEDDNIPIENCYQLIVDGDEEQVIQGIQQIKQDIEQKKDELLRIGDLHACNFTSHFFQPLLHVRKGGKITVLPVCLNESEYQFVTDLKTYCDDNQTELKSSGTELYLLRNLSRGKGVGFFEAGNFHPDFILWILRENRQHIAFIEPHGLIQEGPASHKVQFHSRIKDIEKRLNDPEITLDSFILSWTRYQFIEDWGITKEELEGMHILFMNDDGDTYIEKLYQALYK